MAEKHITAKEFHDEFKQLTDTLDRWRVKIQAVADKHEKTLYGNGEAGMDEQIRVIHAYIQLLVKLAWIVVGAAVTLAVSGTGYAIIYVIRASGK